MTGLEAAVTVETPGSCPVAKASATTEPIDTVARSTAITDGVLIEEFETPPDESVDIEAVEEVFSDELRSIYRFGRNPETPCVCYQVETFGCPVTDVRGRDGSLDVTFRPADVKTLQSIVSSLQDEFDTVRLRHLMQSKSSSDRDPVVVDRGTLTDRQREVIQKAYDMGYFAYPKGANAGEVAQALEIAPSTFREHLSAAQSKLFTDLFEE